MQPFKILAIAALVFAGCQSKNKAAQDAAASNPLVTETAAESSPPAKSADSVDQEGASENCLENFTAAQLLSATGCVDPVRPSKASSNMVPYEVVAPLWTDGSDKQRFLAVPPGSKVTIDANGHLELPVGSLTMKVFYLGGKPIETRFIMRETANRWRTFSYEWRDDGSDAELLSEGKEKQIGEQIWVYPSANQCQICHNKVSGVTLGLTVLQLTQNNQLTAFEKAGLLEKTSEIAATGLVDYKNPNESIDDRARSYLHSNCAFCHQPKGPGLGQFDLRFQAGFVAMGICNKKPLFEVFPIEDAQIYKPSNPNESVLLLRMSSAGDLRMPPQVSKTVDREAVELMKKWMLLRSDCEL